MAVPNTTSSGAVFLPQHDNDRRVMLNDASIFLHHKRGRTRFRLIAIIDSGDPDHCGDDGAVRLPLTVFNQG
jgi:hypothetical protein